MILKKGVSVKRVDKNSIGESGMFLNLGTL